MASVSFVASADFRTPRAAQQNAVPEGDDGFSQLLDAVTDKRPDAGATEAPKAARNRDDVSSRPAKSQSNAGHQDKKDTLDPEKAESKVQPEASRPVTPAAGEGETQGDVSAEGEEIAAVDALLQLALDTVEQPAEPAPMNADATVTEEPAAAPGNVTHPAAIIPAPVAPPLTLAVAVDETITSATPVQPLQGAPIAPAAEVPAKTPTMPAQVAAATPIDLPKVAADVASVPAKALTAENPNPSQAQSQPAAANPAAAPAVQAPAPLETLNAAISKQIQLALGFDAEPQADAAKPLLSSNAVAPNFAVTAQVQAPVSVQTQTAAEVARTVPLNEIAVEIAARATKGERRFDIRLDPPELGRIDVRLETDTKGNTTTKLLVERPETLDLLQRDARGLEKALHNAGLKLESGGLQFSLQQDAQAHLERDSQASDRHGRPVPGTEGELVTEISASNASLAAQLRGGVDIRI